MRVGTGEGNNVLLLKVFIHTIGPLVKKLKVCFCFSPLSPVNYIQIHSKILHFVLL